MINMQTRLGQAVLLLASIMTEQGCQVRAVALQSSQESASLTLEENPLSGTESADTSASDFSELSGITNDASTDAASQDTVTPAASPFQFDLNQIVQDLQDSTVVADDAASVIEGEAGTNTWSTAPHYGSYDDHYGHGDNWETGHHHPTDCHDCGCCDCHCSDCHCGDCHDCHSCDHDCMECPYLADIKLVRPELSNPFAGKFSTHQDLIKVDCSSRDLIPEGVTNEVVANNECGCGVACTKQCGSGCTTKHFKIHGCITVNEEIEKHEHCGEKTCHDGRCYHCSDCCHTVPECGVKIEEAAADAVEVGAAEGEGEGNEESVDTDDENTQAP